MLFNFSGFKREFKSDITDAVNDYNNYADSATFGLTKEYRKHYGAFSARPTKRSRTTPPKLKSRPTKTKTMPLRRRRYRRRRIVRRARRTRRNPRVSATLIRRIAGSLGETKRHVVDAAGNIAGSQNQVIVPLVNIPRAANLTSDAAHNNERMGNKIMLKGIKLHLTFFSLHVRDMYIRLFFGHWKGESVDDDIYKDWQTGKHGNLTTSAPAHVDRLNVTIDRMRYKVLKHKMFKMTGLDDDDAGMSTRHMKIWLPINKIVHYEGSSVAKREIIPNIEMRILPAPADSLDFTPAATNVLRYDCKAVAFFKDN
jgi:hypothetical protein